MTHFRTKPGKYGTLYRFAITYRNDPPDPSELDQTWKCWAYSAEHAEELFYDSEDDGWKIVAGPTKVRDRNR